METEIKKIEKELEEVSQQLQQLENTRNQLLTKIIETQGILKYLKEKDASNKQK